MAEKKHIYSVGKGRVLAYRDTLAEARIAHRDLGLDCRTGIYRWEVGPPPEGVQGRTISNPVKVSRFGPEPAAAA